MESNIHGVMQYEMRLENMVSLKRGKQNANSGIGVLWCGRLEAIVQF